MEKLLLAGIGPANIALGAISKLHVLAVVGAVQCFLVALGLLITAVRAAKNPTA